MAPSLSRKRIVQTVGAMSLLSSVVVAAFFILSALSTSTHRSGLSIIFIVSAIFNASACVPILLFTIFPSHHKQLHRLYGATVSVTTGLVTAGTLGWIGIRQKDLPPNILGRSSIHIAVAGFAVFIVTLVSQSVFWTALSLSTFSTGHPNINCDLNSLAVAPCRCPKSTEMPFPSPTLSTSKASLGSTVRESRHRSFITQVYHPTSSKATLSPMYTTRDKDRQQSSATALNNRTLEVNHFDEWETSDVSARERVATSLAVIERETLEYEKNTRGFRAAAPRKLELRPSGDTVRPSSSVYENDAQIFSPERENSPPLPENDLSPRTCTFPLPVNAILASPVSARFTARGGRDLAGAYSLGGTGKWLARSRTMD